MTLSRISLIIEAAHGVLHDLYYEFLWNSDKRHHGFVSCHELSEDEKSWKEIDLKPSSTIVTIIVNGRKVFIKDGMVEICDMRGYAVSKYMAEVQIYGMRGYTIGKYMAEVHDNNLSYGRITQIVFGDVGYTQFPKISFTNDADGKNGDLGYGEAVKIQNNTVIHCSMTLPLNI